MSSLSARAPFVRRSRPSPAPLASQPGAMLAVSSDPGNAFDVPGVSGDLAPFFGKSEPHILIVDDEPDVRGMMREVLHEEGYATDEAIDGIEGLNAIRRSPRPLVVLLDYKMPRMNGAELLQAVMAEPGLAQRHAFILVTANRPAFSPELLHLLAATAIPVIEKPFSIDALLMEIERAIDRLRASTTEITL